MAVRLILADDHRIVREGLRAWIETQPDMEVIAEAEDGRQAVELVKKHSPDVVIMDISMKGLNGVEATRQIKALDHPPRVIALSMHSESTFVSRMLEAGASAYLLKDCAVEELGDAIREVLAGRVYLSPGITGVVIEDYVRQISRKETPSSPELTAREREVIQLLAEGKTTKQIAFELHVSVKTVETHRQNLMNKLDVASIAELTKYAIREGYTPLDG